MTETTCIRAIAWLIAWDGEEHHYLRDVDLAFSGGIVTFVSRAYDGPAEHEIDGSASMVMPGLVNVHCHPTNQPLLKGVREELGNPHLYGSGLYDYSMFVSTDLDAKRAGAEYTYCELLASGVTTVADLSVPYDGWIDIMGQSGLRGCAAPMYRAAAWRVRDGRVLEYDWDEAAGRKAFAGAVAVIEEAEAHPSGRLFGMVSPAQIDTLDEALMRDSVALARETGRPLQVHTSQSVVEFNEMTRRHGKTPVQWARDIGLLGPGSSIAHGIFIDQHSWIHWPTREDLAILVETGTAIAHCPTVFSRYGHLMQSLGGYLRAGVKLGIGTDTFPHNMIEEMRTAAILSRAAAGNMQDVTTAQVFEVATVGGARMLGREDIGRLAVGARADISIVDLDHPLMQPVRDPLRNLFYTAAERAIRDVYVDGEQVVRDGRVLTLDMADAGRRVQVAQDRMAAAVPERDALGRPLDEVAPMSLPVG